LLSVVLGTLAAYAFSRFRVPGKDDWLFFILSTRMMPPIAVAIPIYLMFRHLGLNDTHLGLILLYTVVNLSLAVWLLKGFMDEIPREYEEAPWSTATRAGRRSSRWCCRRPQPASRPRRSSA
jgi:multiple sugar transport system permease protein